MKEILPQESVKMDAVSKDDIQDENQSETDKLAKSKLVALTFDDGPGKYTDRLLDELLEREVKATFFVLGERVETYPDTARRMVYEGHEIGTHTYGHSNLEELSYNTIKKEMKIASAS